MSCFRVGRRTVLVALLIGLPALGAFAGSAAARTFKPRIGFAMGIEPVHGSQDVAVGTSIPVAYHGGAVMRHVTIHTVFWAPSGYRFDGAPGAGALGYQALIEQFLSDAAHDSGTASNVFSVLNEFGDRSGPGDYRISYDPAVDSISASDPYPGAGRQCVSPSGTGTCVTDLALQHELDELIGADRSQRGLTNLWFIFLPPSVDTCTSLGACATNAYAGYHSLFDLGRGATIYSPVPDPLIELTPPPGSDPQGNPEAEESINTVAHEAIEAITDPVGTAWMDPNGFETADKCEVGPQQGTPLGYAADGSPYNQVINGHQYLIQDIWSNARRGCVQSSSVAAAAPALHMIDLRQYSASISGSIGAPQRVPVTAGLVRAGTLIALAHTETRGNGSWGPITLRGPDGAPHAVGDDRDQLEIVYGTGRGSPAPDAIATGSGGNPFSASGYTGWFDLDNGYAVRSQRAGATTVLLGPCSQTGVLTLRVGPALTEPPVDLCQTETDASALPVGRLGPGTTVTMSSSDNRGEYLLRPNGTLVKLTIALGEPNSVSALGNGQLLFSPTGFPSCTAFLRIRTVRCSGLAPGARYRLGRGGRGLGDGRAGSEGVLTLGGLPVRGGDVLTLINGAGRRLTALHVAHLQVHLIGDQTQVASGICQSGDYWGQPLVRPPVSAAVGSGISGAGRVCPASGRAGGLPTADIAQTDDFSGGQTETQVPDILSTAPIQDETLYGAFAASAQTGLPGPHGSVSAAGVPVSLTIATAASRHRVFHAANVDTARGVGVPALAPGAYVATWVLRDAAGDTRTVTTRFGEG
jgi:hypothetical protein